MYRNSQNIKVNRLVFDWKLKLQLLFLHSSVSFHLFPHLDPLLSPCCYKSSRYSGSHHIFTQPSTATALLSPLICHHSLLFYPSASPACSWRGNWERERAGNSIQFIWLGMVTALMLLGLREREFGADSDHKALSAAMWKMRHRSEILLISACVWGWDMTEMLTFLDRPDTRGVKRFRQGKWGRAQYFTEQNKPSCRVTKQARRDSRAGA